MLVMLNQATVEPCIDNTASDSMYSGIADVLGRCLRVFLFDTCNNMLKADKPNHVMQWSSSLGNVRGRIEGLLAKLEFF